MEEAKKIDAIIEENKQLRKADKVASEKAEPPGKKRALKKFSSEAPDESPAAPPEILDPVKRHTAEVTAQTDALFSLLTSSSMPDSFEALLRSSGLLMDGDVEWLVAKDEMQTIKLERVINDILTVIESYEMCSSAVPTDCNLIEKRMASYASNISSKKKKTLLAVEFLEVPYESIPDYDSKVKTPLSIDILREKLKSHKYSSLRAFTKDFYEMLSNGRHISPTQSLVRFLSFNPFDYMLTFCSRYGRILKCSHNYLKKLNLILCRLLRRFEFLTLDLCWNRERFKVGFIL